MIGNLDRLLWRYEYGKLSPELLELEIRQQLDDNGNAAIDLLAHSSTIRLWNAELLQARSDALREATRAVNRLRFRDAIRHIREHESIVVRIRDLLDAVAAADQADQLMNAAHERAGVPRLHALPAVASLAQLVDVAREFILGQHYLRAKCIASLVSRMASSFLEPTTGASNDADQRLADIESLAAASRPYASPGDDPSADGSVTTLRGLFAGGYGVLAERLLSELETQLGARRRFLLHGRNIGDRGRARELVRELSWDGALDHYWHESLAQYAAVIKEQQSMVAASIVAIDAFFAGEEPI